MWYFRVGRIIGWLLGIALFLGLWVYCIATYGFLLGVGLGWVPAAITAGIIGVLSVPLWAVFAIVIASAGAYFSSAIAAIVEFVIIVVPLIAASIFLLEHLCRRIEKRRKPPAPTPINQEYLDWANREGKWAGDQ